MFAFIWSWTEISSDFWHELSPKFLKLALASDSDTCTLSLIHKH